MSLTAGHPKTDIKKDTTQKYFQNFGKHKKNSINHKYISTTTAAAAADYITLSILIILLPTSSIHIFYFYY